MLSAQTYNVLYVCQHLNGIQLDSEANSPLGWKGGQFTSVSVLYFSAICVPSLYSKRKETVQLRFSLQYEKVPQKLKF